MTQKDNLDWQNRPYYDPFYHPVPVPDADPLDSPKRCVQINDEYIPYVLGAIHRLTRPDAWQGDETEQQEGVQKAYTLLSAFSVDNCEGGIPAGICTDYLPENPYTTYSPQNPFTQPTFVPGGYANPPFYTNVTNVVLGIQPTDVMTDLLVLNPGASLIDLIGFSFPSIHIELNGMGQCELELKKILQGGFCTVTIDGNPLQAKFIDLNAASLIDFTSILTILGVVFGGTLADTHIEEIEFTTPGDHTIDIVFYPNVGGSVLIGFGGGLRRVSFCDESLTGETNYMPVTDMRWNEALCQLEYEFNDDGNWIPVPSGNFYPLDASCKAENLHAKNAANTPGLRLYTDADVERLALELVGANNELDTRESKFLMRFGAGSTNTRQVHFNTDGTVQFVNSIVTPRAKVDIYNDVSSRGTLHLEGRTGQAADTAVLSMGVTNQVGAFTGNAIFIRGVNDANFTLGAAGIYTMDRFGNTLNGAQRMIRALSSAAPKLQREVLTEVGLLEDEEGAVYKPRVNYNPLTLSGNTDHALALGRELNGNPTFAFDGLDPTPTREIEGTAEGNQLLFDLVAHLAEKGIVRVTSVTLGQNCCAGEELCVLYDFRVAPYNSDWNIVNGTWVDGFGYAPSGLTGFISMNMSFTPDCKISYIRVQGENASMFDEVFTTITLDAETLIDLTSGASVTPFGVFNTFEAPDGVGAFLELEMVSDAENPATLTQIEIHYITGGGVPSGGEEC